MTAATLAARIQNIEPAERLLLAAQFLEEKRPDLALMIVRLVAAELATISVLGGGR